jgi:hypothetical protein
MIMVTNTQAVAWYTINAVETGGGSIHGRCVRAWNYAQKYKNKSNYTKAEAEARIKWHIANNYGWKSKHHNRELRKSINSLGQDRFTELIYRIRNSQ